MDETLDVLPGEGTVETLIREKVRRKCDNCGEPAHYKHTFLLPNYRSNPKSSAYGRDDCTWCQDAEQFSCKDPECMNKTVILHDYFWCSTFSASERFAHMFLVWKERGSTSESS